MGGAPGLAEAVWDLIGMILISFDAVVAQGPRFSVVPSTDGEGSLIERGDTAVP